MPSENFGTTFPFESLKKLTRLVGLACKKQVQDCTRHSLTQTTVRSVPTQSVSNGRNPPVTTQQSARFLLVFPASSHTHVVHTYQACNKPRQRTDTVLQRYTFSFTVGTCSVYSVLTSSCEPLTEPANARSVLTLSLVSCQKFSLLSKPKTKLQVSLNSTPEVPLAVCKLFRLSPNSRN